MKFILKILTFIGILLSFCSCHNFNMMTDREIRINLQPNVVWIGIENAGHGSGFIASHGGHRYIITNAHVCQIGYKSGKLQVKSNIDEKAYWVKILKINRKRDLCITTVPRQYRSFGLRLGMQPWEGDEIFVLGFPYGNRKTFVKGEYTGEQTIQIVYGYTEEQCPKALEEVNMLFYKKKACRLDMLSGEITASIYPGNSGSVVVNRRGLVVGVVFAGSGASTVSNYLVPVRFLTEFLNDYILGRIK